MRYARAWSARTSNVLRALAADPARWRYGYDLATEVHLKSLSLYPILVRLADRGLLDTSWEPGVDSRPPRQLYRLTRSVSGASPQRSSVPPTPGAGSRHVALMRTRSVLRRCLDVPIALAAVAALALVWWLQAGRHSAKDGRARTAGKGSLALPVIAAIVLFPWTIGIATRLPHTAVARHWNAAWAGLDVAIMTGLALTSWLGHRRDRLVALTGTATATLMCTDAWFDLCTSAPGRPFAYAVVEAAAELVIATVCLIIGLRTMRTTAAFMLDGGAKVPGPDTRAHASDRAA